MLGKLSRSLGVLGLALLVATPAAVATEGEWTVRVGAPWVESGLDYREVEDGTTLQVVGQQGYGLGLSLERRYSERFGWEFGITWNQGDVDLRFTDPLLGSFVATDTSAPITLSAGPDIHLTPNAKADLYFGPTIAYVLYNDLAFNLLGQTLDVSIDDGFAWGGVLGLDYPVGEEGWYFCSSIRYLDAEADATPEDDPSETVALSVDPLMVAVGFGYRF